MVNKVGKAALKWQVKLSISPQPAMNSTGARLDAAALSRGAACGELSDA